MEYGILIGILIYSFIQTVVLLYKDNSSYYMISSLDVVVAGPFAWGVMLLFWMIRMLLQKGEKVGIWKSNKRERKPYKNKNSRYLSMTIQKVLKAYVKREKRRKKAYGKNYLEEFFNLESSNGDYYGDYNGWNSLLVKKARYERLNNRFSKIMYHQKEDAMKILLSYFEPITEEFMVENELDRFFIQKYKNSGLLRLKEELLQERK